MVASSCCTSEVETYERCGESQVHVAAFRSLKVSHPAGDGDRPVW
jgi:hypothetical protein